jgi:hypothetical protein
MVHHRPIRNPFNTGYRFEEIQQSAMGQQWVRHHFSAIHYVTELKWCPIPILDADFSSPVSVLRTDPPSPRRCACGEGQDEVFAATFAGGRAPDLVSWRTC